MILKLVTTALAVAFAGLPQGSRGHPTNAPELTVKSGGSEPCRQLRDVVEEWYNVNNIGTVTLLAA